jgi:electron-transferring-flavoprotein dehydrogenase
VSKEIISFDVLIIGAGPSGLTTAIQIKKKLIQNNKQATIAVMEKAPGIGAHNLSGAVFDYRCLDLLFPNWKDEQAEFSNSLQSQIVKKDHLYFLTPKHSIKIPYFLRPKYLRHLGYSLVSSTKLTQWLSKKAEKLGIEIYTELSATDLLIEDKQVKGVRIGEKGLNKQGHKLSNYQPQEKIEAKLTILADGSLGFLSKKLIDLFSLAKNKNPQIYSLGIKQIIKIPNYNNFAKNQAIHTIGFPNKNKTFGGSFIYDLGNKTIAFGLVLGLDWPYNNLDPVQELETLKSHPLIQKFFHNSKILETGVKTLPEGGYYSLPQPYTNGALLTGDAAGLVDIRKLKGLHHAIYSGIAAGNTAYQALQKNDFSESQLKEYQNQLQSLPMISEIKKARNFRQVFMTKLGLLAGMPLSLIQNMLPIKLKTKPDYKTTKRKTLNRKPLRNSLKRKDFVYHAGIKQNEDIFSHIKILDPTICQECKTKFNQTCTSFCPAQVFEPAQNQDNTISISASDCLHCCTCTVKCPYQNIEWTPPEGGSGPKYQNM